MASCEIGQGRVILVQLPITYLLLPGEHIDHNQAIGCRLFWVECAKAADIVQGPRLRAGGALRSLG